MAIKVTCILMTKPLDLLYVSCIFRHPSAFFFVAIVTSCSHCPRRSLKSAAVSRSLTLELVRGVAACLMDPVVLLLVREMVL